MSRPLKGRKILVTRSRSQAGEFSRLLRQAGAEVAEIPAIEIVPRPDRELDACISRVHRFDWIFFTSVNGAEIFLSRAREAASHLFQKNRPIPPNLRYRTGDGPASGTVRLGSTIGSGPLPGGGSVGGFPGASCQPDRGPEHPDPASQPGPLPVAPGTEPARRPGRSGTRLRHGGSGREPIGTQTGARRRRARPHHLHQFLNSSTPDESGNRSGSSPVSSLRRHRSDHGGYCPRTWVSGGRRIPAVNHPEPVRRYLSKLQPIGKRKIKGR